MSKRKGPKGYNPVAAAIAKQKREQGREVESVSLFSRKVLRGLHL